MIKDCVSNKRLPGAPEGWFVSAPAAPPDSTQTPLGFENINNHVGYLSYPKIFKPKYKKNSMMDAGGSNSVTGKQHIGHWEFHYNRWKLEDTIPKNISNVCTIPLRCITPWCVSYLGRWMSWCIPLFNKMWLAREHMVCGNTIFFCQFLLPICDSLILNTTDPQSQWSKKSFICLCLIWSTKSTHLWRNTMITMVILSNNNEHHSKELLHFSGIAEYRN